MYNCDSYSRPERNYKIIEYRPLPAANVRNFGNWIVHEQWSNLKKCTSSSEQAKELDTLLLEKLDLYCPKKSMKLSNVDKLFITSDIKRLDRQRRREYLKRGKTLKYYDLKKQFNALYKAEAKKYLDKNLESLSSCNPGQAYKILKRLGSQPGDTSNNCETFILPDHELLPAADSAERIALHFSEISQSFPPLSVQSLPQRVKDKLSSPGCAPKVSEYEVYRKMIRAKKPRSGTQYDLPKEIMQEFCPEIAGPLTKLINQIFESAEWPSHWKLEHVVPIP